MKNKKIYIGTSGWNYWHWQGVFYPENLKSQDLLSYYAKYFSTVEINSSFYHLPREITFNHWREKVPNDFLFSVKVWRKITHLKKLNRVKEDFKIFWQRVLVLKEKLGPLLFQFPPSFRVNHLKLENFCQDFLKIVNQNQPVSFEFRHQSWFSETIYKILKKYNFALCWADTPCYPYKEVITANYLYLRLHGHNKLYASKYSQTQLREYSKKIKKFLKKGKVVYVYFDNDAYGYAIENALELKRLLKS